MMLDETDRLEKAEEEWFSKSSEIMKESAVVWTPLGEVVVPQLQKIGEHHDWKETERALSIYGKTGKYAIALYYVLTQAGHNHAERMIDVVVPSEIIGRKIQSFFRIITGKNLPQGNIYVCDPSAEWGPDFVSEDVYVDQKVEPLIPGLFEPKVVEPEEDGKRKKYLTLEPIMKYDVVIGNPPFNPQREFGSKESGNSTTLWPDFVKKSLKLTKEGGILSLIHPALWRQTGNAIGKILRQYNIKWLSMNDDSKGDSVFGVKSKYDVYVLQKSSTDTEETEVLDYNDDKHEIVLGEATPNFGLSVWEKVRRKEKKSDLKVIRDSNCHTQRDYVKKEESNEFQYQLFNSESRKFGRTYRYSKKPHKNQFEKKVIFSNGRHIYPFYDDGKLGTTEGGIYIVVDSDKQGKNLVDILNSNVASFLIAATKWSNFATHPSVIQLVVSRINPSKSYTDEGLYDHFNLSDDEIQEIEQFLS